MPCRAGFRAAAAYGTHRLAARAVACSPGSVCRTTAGGAGGDWAVRTVRRRGHGLVGEEGDVLDDAVGGNRPGLSRAPPIGHRWSGTRTSSASLPPREPNPNAGGPRSGPTGQACAPTRRCRSWWPPSPGSPVPAERRTCVAPRQWPRCRLSAASPTRRRSRTMRMRAISHVSRCPAYGGVPIIVS